jgi:hypothetical protein
MKGIAGMVDKPLNREAVDARIIALHREIDLRIDAVEKFSQEGFKSRDGALDRQAVEYERRLESLNSNLRMMLDERAHYLTKEVFEAFAVEHRRFQDTVNRQMTISNTRILTWTSAIGLFVIIVSIAVQLLWD